MKTLSWSCLFRCIFLWIGIFIGFFGSTNAAADTYYVATDGNNAFAGTITQPWQTIQHAADTLRAGDIVYIRGGIYNDRVYTTASGNADAPIIFSAYPEEQVILDGTGVSSGGNGFLISHDHIHLRHLEIRNWPDNGIWAMHAGFLEISDCEVSHVVYGIGLADGSHDFVLNRVLIHHFDLYGVDASPSGGADCYNGVFNDCNAHTGRDPEQNVDGFAIGHGGQHDFTFNRCTAYNVFDGFDISGNRTLLDRCSAFNCANGGYKIWADQITLTNCLSYNNGISNLELDWDGTPGTTTLRNCTFMDADTYNIWVENSGDALHMVNCILAGGDNIGLAFEQRSVANYTGDYNLFHNDNPGRVIAVGYEDEFSADDIAGGDWTAYSGNQDAHSLTAASPADLFVDAGNFDLHLSETSPAIDNGTNTNAPTRDFEGNSRPKGESVDIGAYEYGQENTAADAGDINGDGTIDLGDLILALKICTETETSVALNPSADVNCDHRIGLAEALFIMNYLSGVAMPSEGLVKSSVLYDSAPVASDADQKTLVAGFSEFTLDFYHALRNAASSSGKNLFFSPYSIENALAMTWAGANGQTSAQMADALHLNLPQDRFHPTLNALNIDINSRDDQPPPSGDPFALSLVNAVWSRIGYPFLPNYLDLIAKNYDTGVRTLDFAGNPARSRQTINLWVEDQTNEKIKDLLPPGSISPSTAVVLTNAIYFKGSWYEKFNAERTAPGSFTLLDQTVVTAHFMHRQTDTRYFKGNGFDVVELPYASPKFPEYAYPQELAMLVIIPHAGEFQSVEAGLDIAGIESVIDALSMGTVNLTFPKFEFACETRCKDILTGLGMTDAFDWTLADFSNMVSPVQSRPWIDEVFHKAFVAVDENGTEAAAATAVVMSETGMPQITTLSADRPFMFIIYDHFTQTILFMGRVLDPTA